jgi:hypothetical protein
MGGILPLLVIFGFAIFGPNPAETDRCPALFLWLMFFGLTTYLVSA